MRQTLQTQTHPKPATPAAAAQAAPRGELASRVLAMPADTNPMGNIFGGWIMSLMDKAGGMTATKVARGPVVTVAVSKITFLQPVKVGDVICCYTDVARLGTTSITLAVEVWVLRQGQGERIKVTDAEYTFVAVGRDGRPRPVLEPVAGEEAPGGLGPRTEDCHDPAAEAAGDRSWTLLS